MALSLDVELFAWAKQTYEGSNEELLVSRAEDAR